MRINKNNLFYYILSFLIIYISGSVISIIRAGSYLYNALLFVSILLITYSCLKEIIKNKIYKQDLIFYFYIFIFTVIEYLISPQTVSFFITRILWFLLFYYTIKNAKRNNIDVFHILYKVIIYISAITLFFYIVVSLLKIKLPYTVIISDSSVSGSLRYNNYFNVFFQNLRTNIQFGKIMIPRLSGLFWEAGVYQIYLNYAIFRLLFIEKWNFKIFLLLFINLFFTFSTSGWCLFVLLFILKLIDNFRVNKKNKILLYIPALLILLLLFTQIMAFKFTTGKTSIISYNDRLSDIYYGIKTFELHPILGTGFNNIEQFKILQGKTRGNTNGIITILFSFGIVGSFFIILPFIKNIFNNKNTKISKNLLIFYLWFIISNATEPIGTTPLFLLFFANEALEMNNKSRERI